MTHHRRSKAWVCVRSLARISGSNPIGVMDVCVLSGRGLCYGPIPCPEESYRVCVCVCVTVIRCNSKSLHLQRLGRKKSDIIIIIIINYYGSGPLRPVPLDRKDSLYILFFPSLFCRLKHKPHQISNTQRTKNKTTNAVIQQHSRKLLMMDILMSETC